MEGSAENKSSVEQLAIEALQHLSEEDKQQVVEYLYSLLNPNDTKND